MVSPPAYPLPFLTFITLAQQLPKVGSKHADFVPILAAEKSGPSAPDSTPAAKGLGSTEVQARLSPFSPHVWAQEAYHRSLTI